MEKLSKLLVLGAGNLTTYNKGPVMWTFDEFFVIILISSSTKCQVSGDCYYPNKLFNQMSSFWWLYVSTLMWHHHNDFYVTPEAKLCGVFLWIQILISFPKWNEMMKNALVEWSCDGCLLSHGGNACLTPYVPNLLEETYSYISTHY